ncbi:glycosyltransferase family 2 protein [Candidatus Margulisiibacteriota bacterium]
MIHFLSVVIPTYNHLSSLKNTLKSFCHQTFNNFEVVIADDGSTDGTGDYVQNQKWSFPLQYFRQENKGRSAARNLGWQNAKGDIIVFIDDHAILDSNFLEEHYKTHLEFENTNTIVVRGHAPRIGDLANIAKINKTPAAKEKNWLLKHESDPFRTFCTNNISIRKFVLKETNGFDEDFKEYGFQDAELGWRVKLAGYKFKINLQAVACIFSIKQGLLKRCDKMRQAGHSAVLFRKKHPFVGLHLVNIFSRIPYALYSVFDSFLLKRLFNKVSQNIKLENKLRYFFHSLGIAEALNNKKDFPSTEEVFNKYSI